MEIEKDSANGRMQFLTELASATTRYYEAQPDGSEQARIEYEQALTRFKNSISTEAAASSLLNMSVDDCAYDRDTRARAD
jgi:recombinational DNA repair ATPase RecF